MIHYNTIHNQYRLPLDLYFRLINDHPEYRGIWICLSNIPALNLKILIGQTHDECLLEVKEVLKQLNNLVE